MTPVRTELLPPPPRGAQAGGSDAGRPRPSGVAGVLRACTRSLAEWTLALSLSEAPVRPSASGLVLPGARGGPGRRLRGGRGAGGAAGPQGTGGRGSLLTASRPRQRPRGEGRDVGPRPFPRSRQPAASEERHRACGWRLLAAGQPGAGAIRCPRPLVLSRARAQPRG